MIDIIQNPMFIAIVVGSLTYLYMWWRNEKEKENNNKSTKKINILIPAVVTFITWAIVYGYYSTLEGSAGNNTSNITSNGNADVNNLEEDLTIPKLTNKTFKLTDGKMNNTLFLGGGGGGGMENNMSESVRSYQLVGKGLNIPNNLNLPDVFIETYE